MLDPTDLNHSVANPIKRAGFFDSDKTVYPFTVTGMPAKSSTKPWW
jgi:hypothetical protein